ncbi:hypothetical protein Tco_1518448, partial [Tanacetum coccineum]
IRKRCDEREPGACVEGCVMKRTKEVMAGGGGQRRRWLEKDGDDGGDVQPVHWHMPL